MYGLKFAVCWCKHNSELLSGSRGLLLCSLDIILTHIYAYREKEYQIDTMITTTITNKQRLYRNCYITETFILSKKSLKIVKIQQFKCLSMFLHLPLSCVEGARI